MDHIYEINVRLGPGAAVSDKGGFVSVVAQWADFTIKSQDIVSFSHAEPHTSEIEDGSIDKPAIVAVLTRRNAVYRLWCHDGKEATRVTNGIYMIVTAVPEQAEAEEREFPPRRSFGRSNLAQRRKPSAQDMKRGVDALNEND